MVFSGKLGIHRYTVKANILALEYLVLTYIDSNSIT